MTDDIRVLRDGALMEVRMNRPAKKNALTDAMYGAMADAILAAGADPEVRAVLISAEGDMFTAGNDLADFAAAGAAPSIEEPRGVQRFLDAIATAQKPLIAAVTGHGVGVGMTMLLHCDVVIIAEDARLTTPFTSLGVTPEAASSLLLPARIGHTKAFMMLALGQPVSGADAARIGIATEALPRGEVDARARAVARECCARPAEAMRITKMLMRDPLAVTARIAEETGHFRERLRSPEAQAAFAAFFKR